MINAIEERMQNQNQRTLTKQVNMRFQSMRLQPLINLVTSSALVYGCLIHA